MRLRDFNQIARAAHIDLLGQLGLFLAGRRNLRGEVHDRLNAFDRSADFVYITDVGPAHFDLTAETLRHFLRARFTQIERADLMSLSQKFRGGMTADIAKSSGEQNAHDVLDRS